MGLFNINYLLILTHSELVKSGPNICKIRNKGMDIGQLRSKLDKQYCFVGINCYVMEKKCIRSYQHANTDGSILGTFTSYQLIVWILC